MRRSASTSGEKCRLALALAAALAACAPPTPREVVTELAERAGWSPPAGRLCCGWPPPGSSGAAGDLPPLRPEVLAPALTELTRRHRESPSAETLAGLAGLEALEGDWAAAIARLEEAVALDPARADLASDLGAVRLARGVTEDRPLELLRALEHTLEATREAPELAEAWFNHAEILERLELRGEAARAWGRYLGAEVDPGWETVGREHRERMLDMGRVEELLERVRPIEAGWAVPASEIAALAAAQPHLLRELGEEKLLGLWGEALAAGREPEAESFLGLAETIGRELARQWGDHLLADTVNHVLAGEPSARTRLAEAFQLYREAMVTYYAQLFAEADEDLAAAERILLEAGSPLTHSTALYRAICLYYLDVRRSRAALASVTASFDPDRYPSLAGRTYWMRGVVEMVQGEFEEAISLYGRTRGYLARGSGPVRAAMADLLLAEAYDSRGEVELGWRHRLAAARVIAPTGDARKRHAVLQDSVQALVRREMSEQALVFLEEEVANSHVWGREMGIVEALAQRSRVHSQLGESERAETDAREAIAIAERIEDAAARLRVEASARLSLGIALAERRPEESLEILRVAQAEHAATGWDVERFAFFDASARAHRALGELEAAEKILFESVSTFEEMRRQALDVRARLLIIQHARKAYDQLIELALDRGEAGSAVAFEIAERSRARYLLDRWASDEPLTLAQVASALPPGERLVHYAEVGDRVVAWVVAEGKVGWSELAGSSGEVERTVERLREAMRLGDGARAKDLGASLYDALIRPLDLDLTGQPRLVIVPEGALARVPFAALFDGERGGYLIERASVTFAPSATIYLSAIARARRERPGRAEALIVGAPRPAASEWPSLPPLALAEREARAIAELYPESRLLIGAEATAEAFLGRLGAQRVVHFAGHAVTRGDDVDDAWLLLSEGPGGEPGAVPLARLWELELGAVDLVVLSSCYGLDGLERGREGVVSLASAFLAAGVPTVVAALWQVDDLASYQVMTRFHELVAGGQPPAAALRKVMIEAIRSGDPQRGDPAHWGAFAVLGV